MIAFWDKAPRSLVEADEHSRDAHLGLLQQDYAAIYSRKLLSSYLPLPLLCYTVKHLFDVPSIFADWRSTTSHTGAFAIENLVCPQHRHYNHEHGM
jgi:hypothetical protein